MRRTPVDSTTLSAAGYADQTSTLELLFRSGELYRYFGVPRRTYWELLHAESKGGYFNEHIRNRFAFEHVQAVPRLSSKTQSHSQ